MNHVLTIAGKKYAAGLFWQVAPASATPLQMRREAINFARRLKPPHHFICLKNVNGKQFGVGGEGHRYRAHLPSAAETLAQNIPAAQSLLGVWQTRGQFWLCALRAGAIHPNGDRVFSSEKSARAAFDAMDKEGGWDVKIAPPQWKIAAVRSAPLADFLHKTGAAEIVRIRPARYSGLAIAAAMTLLVATGGIWLARQTSPPETISQQIAAARPLDYQRQQRHSWQFLPANRHIHEHCMRSVYAFYHHAVPGWTVAEIHCDLLERTFSASWVRSGGTAKGFSRYAQKLRAAMPYERMRFADEGRKAEITARWILSPDIVITSAPPAMPLAEAEVHLWSLRQGAAVSLSFSRAQIDPRAVLVPAGMAARRGRGLHYHLSTIIAPEKALQSLYEMPGSVIYQISFHRDSNKWNVRGFIHHTEETDAL